MTTNGVGDGHLSTTDIETLYAAAEDVRESMVSFTRKLVQTPSLPGEEAEVADLVATEMRALGYDDVTVDEAGNVIGSIRSSGVPAIGRSRRSVMFNTHMDHVDVGDPDKWPFPPYAATVHDGHIWGRATSDLKGPLACQVYAGAVLKRAGLPLPNDVYVVGVVQEEVGGLGSSVLADHLQTDYAIIGEPSENRLALGHRGRLEIHVTITGRSVHASVPRTGLNPLFSAARFLQQVESLEFEPDPEHPALGPTTVAPTLFSTDQTSANVLPGECRMVLDVRNSPIDTPERVLPRVRELLYASLEPGTAGECEIKPVHLTSYTGITRTFSNAAAPFGTSPDSPLVLGAKQVLGAALRRPVETQMWRFATDAGHLVSKGIQVIGFGPGYEDVIHTVNEKISINMMVEGLVANASLALGLD